jgi:ribosomal protein S27E
MSIFNVRAVISAVLHLKRKCPKCGREQVVPASDRHNTVPCKFCGEPVPPPKRE